MKINTLRKYAAGTNVSARLVTVIISLFVLAGTISSHAWVVLVSGHFRDWQDNGCHQNPSVAGGPLSGASGNGNQASCQGCQQDHGIPRWWVDEPYINLHLSDTPLSYNTSAGEMTFRMFYKQRYALPQPDECPDFYSLGNTLAYRAIDHPYVQYMRSYNAGNFTNACWGHNWMMNITFWDSAWESLPQNTRRSTAVFSQGYEALVFRPEGGIFYVSSGSTAEPISRVQLKPMSSLGYPVCSNTPSTNASGIYWGDPGVGFKLVYPDGSQDIFGLAEYITTFLTNNPSVPDTTADALLTQKIDPQGRITRIGYEKVSFTNIWVSPTSYSAHRVKYVVDTDGRTNTFIYSTNSPATAWQLAEIRDPYGRKASFTYEFSADSRLTSIKDAGGNSNSFAYANFSGWINRVTTPYGNTSFNFFNVADPATTNGFLQRAVCVSEPEGANQLFYYAHTNQFLATSEPTPIVAGQTFDSGTNGGAAGGLYVRNSFHWDRRQFAALSSAVRAALPTNINGALNNASAGDFNKAYLKHWLLGADNASITESISSERDPSPDSAGSTAGARTWYAYANKPSPEIEGDAFPSCIARLLPDSTSQFTSYTYDLNYPPNVTRRLQSYTLPDGSVGSLTNYFLYYPLNGIDLLSVSNSVGQFLKFAYNSSHQPTFITNALNQVTKLNYDNTSHNLNGLTNFSGLRFQFTWNGVNPPDPNGGLLQNISVLGTGRSISLTWTNGLPRTTHDDLGFGLTFDWDNLNRPTTVYFPDSSTISNIYDRLDLGATKDQLDNWTRYAHDGLQHLTYITNALQAVTHLSWCDCGSLATITDPLTNTTSFFYNNQVLLTNVNYPDGSSLTYTFDNALRMTSVTDSLNRSLNFGYNNQGLITTVSNSIGQVQRTLFDAVNRPIQFTDANGVSHTNTWDALNNLLTRVWVGGGAERFGYSSNGLIAYTNQDNQVTRFLRDAAGRATAITNANLEVNRFEYNSIDEITKLIDGLNHTNRGIFNEYGLLTNKIDGLNHEVLRLIYDANLRVTNRWTPEFGNAGYGWDQVGNLKTITYPLSTINFGYNANNWLTNMVDQSGTNSFTWTQVGQLAGEDGPWANDTVSFSYAERQRAFLSLGSLSWSYNYDSIGRMTNILSPVGTFGYQYPASGIQYRASAIFLPNAASITNHFDTLARLDYTALVSHWGHVLDAYTYAHDPLGLRTNILRDFGFTNSSVGLGYDNIAQVTSWSAREDATGPLRQNEQLAWAYDPAHNLRFRTNGGLTQTFTVDGANQLTNIFGAGALTFAGVTPGPANSVTVNGINAETYGDFTFASTNLALNNGSNTFTTIAHGTNGLSVTNSATFNLPSGISLLFDANGNLTNDGLRSFSYDAENQLTNVYVIGAWKTEWVYDGLHRRRLQRDYAWTVGGWNKTNETRFVYDGLLPIQERDSNNTPLVTYTRGLDLSGSLSGAGGIGGLLARTDNSGSNFYHADGAGNITALVSGLGDVTARYLYNPFGKTIAQWGPMADANRYRFSSKEIHPSSGTYNFGYRFYEPNLQRWLNRDPIGESGGVNLYRFVENSPPNITDTDGRFGMYMSQADQTAVANNAGAALDALGPALQLAADALDAIQAPIQKAIDSLQESQNPILHGAGNAASIAQWVWPEGEAAKAAKLGKLKKAEKAAAKCEKAQRTAAENRKARNFFKNHKDEAREAWEKRTGMSWPEDSNGNPWPAHHDPPLKEGGDPLHVEPQNPNGPDPHNIPGPDGLTDYQRWGKLGPEARKANGAN